MFKLRMLLPAFLLVAAYALPAMAQEGEAHHLESVVVSTTRTEIPVFDAAQDVTVLSSEEIMASPFERVEDIVRSVPGIHNFRHYGLQTNGIVSPLIMRGVGKNRVLLLVDGVPQNDNFNNGIAWVGWGHVPKDTIERIEIVRGPTSALYGSEGLGGVIHIITKKPSAKRKTSIRGHAGSGNTYEGAGFHSQTFGDFGVMLAGGYEETDGYYMKEESEREDYEIKRHRNLGRALGKAVYDLGPETDISLSALYYDYDGGQGRKFFYNEMALDQYWLNFKHQADSFGLKGLVFLSRVDKTAFQDTANNNFTSPFRDEKMKGAYTWGADLQSTVEPLAWAPVTFGLAFKEAVWNYDEDYPGSTRDAGAEGKQRTVSPFVNMDMRFLENDLIVNVGARYDWIETRDGMNYDTQASAGKPAYRNTYDTNRESSFSPKLGVAFHPDDKTTLRASGGKGFRAPSLFELYKVHVRGGGAYYREANPDLKPEEIWSYDIGAERYLLDNLWAKVGFYQSWAKDYIGDRLVNTGTFAGGRTRSEYVLDNISEVDIYGFTAEMTWDPIQYTTLFANYTYNISKIGKDEENRSLEGNYLTNDPQHAAHFGVRYADPAIVDLTLMANYYANIYYDNENTSKNSGYWTVDAAISRKFYDQLTLFVNIENLFNKKYDIFRSASTGDTTAPGIIVLGGVKFEF